MTALTVPTQHGGVAVAAGVAEHRVEDGDAVGADDADSAELLEDADEDDDEEGFVHLGVAPQVPHVVALALLVLSGQQLLRSRS